MLIIFFNCKVDKFVNSISKKELTQKLFTCLLLILLVFLTIKFKQKKIENIFYHLYYKIVKQV